MITSAAAGAAGAAGAAPGDTAPIYLSAQPAGDGVRVEVIGAPSSDVHAVYTLEVVSDTSGNANRSTQRSEARMRGGDRATLISVTLGNVTPGRWHARLSVEPVGGAPYQQSRTSTDGS